MQALDVRKKVCICLDIAVGRDRIMARSKNHPQASNRCL